MLVSHDWLSQYVKLEMSHDELVHKLTMSGLNHEGTQAVNGDQQIDLEVTSNRSDCLGHIGVAREIAVLFEQTLQVPDPRPAAAGESIDEHFGVSIECPDLCYRFTARMIRGVKVGPSPQWLVDRLTTANIGIVNNVVDISNYVMLECGQPLHTFDYDRLAGRKIVVREPRPNEQLEAIDHHTYALEPGMCVIADADRAVGLGGVMGGMDTEVSDETTNVLVEAAYFNPIAIRNTARRLNLHSPASFRFERAIDSHQIDWASRRCCELILEIAGGELVEGMIDVGQPPSPRNSITLRYAQLDRILGIQVPAERADQILVALGFVIENQAIENQAIENQAIENQDSLSVTVVPPSWRRDVTREVDLIEEVGRIYGYDNVPDDVDVPMAASVRTHSDRVIEKIRRGLSAAGFDEAMTASLVPQKWSASFSPWSQSPPLQSNQPMLGVLEKASQNIGPVNLLRRSIVPSLLEVFRINEYKQNEQVDLYEFAKVYLSQESGLPAEPWKIALVSCQPYEFVKGAIESIIGLLNPAAELDAQPCDLPILDVTYAAQLSVRYDAQPSGTLGWIGQVDESGKDLFGFRRDATVAELDFAVLRDVAVPIVKHQDVSQYPAVHRDFNFIVGQQVTWSALSSAVRSSEQDTSEEDRIIESVSYKETFRDPDKDGPDRRRVLMSVVLRSKQGTLTGKQAERVCQQIVSECRDHLGAELLA